MARNRIFRAADKNGLIKGRFQERLNRFVVRVSLDNNEVVKAYLPNPGRLHELLLPEARLYLVKNPAGPKTSHTVLAVDRDKVPVFLHTGLTNQAARALLENGLVPSLSSCRIVRAEVPYGRSRFDFLLECGGRPLYLEVKSCTLYGGRVAMFPDAVTERGRRHLEELAGIAKGGTDCAVLFLIHTPNIDWFMPDYHTDLAFSRTLLDVRRSVRILPVTAKWTSGLELEPESQEVPVPWEHLEQEVHDRGPYILLINMKRSRSLTKGGKSRTEAGWYIYLGHEAEDLTRRIKRHKGQLKRTEAPIDRLCEKADRTIALPVRSSRDRRAAMAADLAGIFPKAGADMERFSGPEFPLFYSEGGPLAMEMFHRSLEKHRMRSPGSP